MASRTRAAAKTTGPSAGSKAAKAADKPSRSATKAVADSEAAAKRAANKQSAQTKRNAQAAQKAAAAEQAAAEDEEGDEEAEDEDDAEDDEDDEEDEEEPREMTTASGTPEEWAAMREQLQLLQAARRAAEATPLGEGVRWIFVETGENTGVYERQRMGSKECKRYMRATFGVAVSEQTFESFEYGHLHLVPLSALMPAPTTFVPILHSIITEGGWSNPTGSSFKGSIKTSLDVIQAVRQFERVARALWGPRSSRTKYFGDFAERLITEMGGTLQISMEDAINWWTYNSIKHLTGLPRLDSEEVRNLCMRLDLTAVHQTAAALRAAADRRSEPKVGRGRDRDNSPQRDGRQSRERSRERSPQHQFRRACKDHNKGRCSRQACKYEHICAACGSVNHIVGARECRKR